MQCRYCQASNHEEEHRCVRCGRRLHSAIARPGPEWPPIQTATAPDLMEYSDQATDSPSIRLPEPDRSWVVYQRPLFRELQPVIQIPALRGSEGIDTLRPPRPSRPRNA